ncbi:MAG: signal peptidase [Clostridia bacterium]|nr:signal peptidase [Clostridia bacterium]
MGECKKSSTLVDILQSVTVAAILAFLIRTFLFTPFYIPSKSMEPTLYPNDRIIVNRLAYRWHEPERGDVIVFRYPLDPQRDYIKRIVALGGEEIEARGGHLYVNGRRLNEDYLPKGVVLEDFGPVKVPEGSYFMMGDNRKYSADSRVWGALERKYILGKALLVFWPPDHIKLIK